MKKKKEWNGKGRGKNTQKTTKKIDWRANSWKKIREWKKLGK